MCAMTAVYFKKLDLDVSPNNPVSIATASRGGAVSELACLNHDTSLSDDPCAGLLAAASRELR